MSTITINASHKSGPSINRFRSKQDYTTPEIFRQAIVDRFGAPYCDLAATEETKFGIHFIGEWEDSLTSNWSLYSPTDISFLPDLLWANPPFSDIAPWAKKCAIHAEHGCRILLLVPASVDSNWWCDYVHGKAWVEFLSPRISFDGKNPFPKPCALVCYNVAGIGYGTWRWKP